MGFFDSINPFSSGSPISALTGDYGLLSNPTGAWDKFKNGNTNDVNYAIAQENLKYQRENLDYQKALQQKIFDREDSSYSRTVQDMRNAGISPLMMSGTNGAGEAIATSPLHNEFQMQDKGIAEVLGSVLSSASAVQEIKRQQLENESIELENKYSEETFKDRVAKTVAERIFSQIQSMDKEDERKTKQFFGYTDNMPEDAKKAAIASKLLVGGDDLSAPSAVKNSLKSANEILGKTDDYDPSDPYDSTLSRFPVIGYIFRKARDLGRSIKRSEGVKNAKKARQARK